MTNRELLDKELDILKCSGVQYMSKRVESKMEKDFLIVTLGGCGADVFIELKKLIRRRIKLPQGDFSRNKPCNVEFLEIDSDVITQRQNSGTLFGWNSDEFCDISEIQSFIHGYRKGSVQEFEWLDDDVIDVYRKYLAASRSGAGGIRQIGRMQLFANIDRVYQAILCKLNALRWAHDPDRELNIFLVSGISGGTGGGTFLDMAYILKILASGISNSKCCIHGYLFMPNVHFGNVYNIEIRETLKANGFASIKELDYWMNSEKRGEKYKQHTHCGFAFDLDEAGKPFDFCHLLNAVDKWGHLVSYEEIIQSAAEHILNCITDIENYPGYHNYLTLETAVLEIPYTQIATHMAAKVFQKLEKELFSRTPGEEEILKDFTDTIGFDRNAIELLYSDFSHARPALQRNLYTAADIWGENLPYQHARKWMTAFWEYLGVQEKKVSEILSVRLKEFIKDRLFDNRTGPFYLQKLCGSCTGGIPGLERKLYEYRQYIQMMEEATRDEFLRMDRKRDELFVEGRALGIISKKRVKKDYLYVVEDWYRCAEKASVYQVMGRITEKLYIELQLYNRNIIQPLTYALHAVSDILGEHETIIRNYMTPFEKDGFTFFDLLEFEKAHQSMIDSLADNAVDGFLKNVSDHLFEWIGCDMEDVDRDCCEEVHVTDVLSEYISFCFDSVMRDVEFMLEFRLQAGENFTDYVKKRIMPALSIFGNNNHYPMDWTNRMVTDLSEELVVILIPEDCSTLYEIIKNNVEMIRNNIIIPQSHTNVISVRKSKDCRRILMMRITAGELMRADGYLGELEAAYNGQMGNRTACIGRHLDPRWKI